MLLAVEEPEGRQGEALWRFDADGVDPRGFGVLAHAIKQHRFSHPSQSPKTGETPPCVRTKVLFSTSIPILIMPAKEFRIGLLCKFDRKVGHTLSMKSIVSLAVKPFLSNLRTHLNVKLWSHCDKSKIEKLMKIRS
jgi:hypothetical protein